MNLWGRKLEGKLHIISLIFFLLASSVTIHRAAKERPLVPLKVEDSRDGCVVCHFVRIVQFTRNTADILSKKVIYSESD